MNRLSFRVLVSVMALGVALFLGLDRNALAQSTDISVDPSVEKAWNSMRIARNPGYMTLKATDDFSSIVVEKTLDSSVSYDDFLASIPDRDPRFYLIDFRFVDGGGAARSRLILVVWLPENASTKSKMLYSSSQANVAALSGIGSVIQAAEKDDITYDAVLQVVSR